MSILSDVKEIEAKVRESMENGLVTPYYTLPSIRCTRYSMVP
jgi:hypothetical protein